MGFPQQASLILFYFIFMKPQRETLLQRFVKCVKLTYSNHNFAIICQHWAGIEFQFKGGVLGHPI